MTFTIPTPVLIPADKNFKSVCRFLNKVVSHENWGRLTFDRKQGKLIPKHCNSNEAVKAVKLRQRAWLPRLTHKAYGAHFRGEETYYFTANEYADRCLIKLDIDCHKKGTLAGAKAFAEYLKGGIFPGLYYEVSTNGNGIHCYVFFRKTQKTPDQVCDWLDRLEVYLRRIEHRFDVELIEVKGQPRRLVMDGRRLVRVQAGELAKIPREIIERFDEFWATTELDIETFDFPALEFAKATPQRVAVGSSSRRHVGDWHKLEGTARQILGGQDRIKITEELAITVEDVAVLLAILQHCCHHPNTDGSMPTARIQALWEAMYAVGDTSRQFQPRRYAAVRNLLDQVEGIEWKANFYLPGAGVAAKWQLKPKFLAEIDRLMGETAVELDLHGSLQDGERPLVVGDLGWVPESQITRPEPLWPSLVDTPDANTIEMFLTPRFEIDKFLGLAA